MTMESHNIFYTKYVSLARSADALFARVSQMEDEVPKAINDIRVYCGHLIQTLPLLNEYPLMVESLFRLVEKDGMTGNIGVFIIDNMATACEGLKKREQEICKKIDSIRSISITIDNRKLDELQKKVLDWRRNVCLDNIKIMVEYIESIQSSVDDLYGTFEVQEQLRSALAKSEEERKKMADAEWVKKKKISESAAEKEERRRKAREAYAKNRVTRKK